MKIPDFTPVGKQTTASSELFIDETTQKDLVSAIAEVADQIEMSPYAAPSHREVHLGRISLRDSDGERDPQGLLNLHFSENDTGLSNAVIGVQHDSDSVRFRLSPGANDWEVLRQDTTPDRILSNESVVAILDDLLYKKDALKPLLDTAAYPALEIPRLLADQFSHTAPSRKIITAFDTFSGRIANIDLPDFPEIEIPDYDISTFSRLCIARVRGYSQYHLSVQSPIAVGQRTIHKKYSYEFRENSHNRRLLSAVGKIGLTSFDGYSPQELASMISHERRDMRESEFLENIASDILRAHTFPRDQAA